LVDPVFEQVRRDAALIEELGLHLLYTIDTHVHADHVTGAWMLNRRTGSRIAISAASGAEGADRYLSHGDKVEVEGVPFVIIGVNHGNGRDIAPSLQADPIPTHIEFKVQIVTPREDR